MKKVPRADNVEQTFPTDHLYLTAFLVCRGHTVVGTEPDDKGRIRFL